MMIPIISGAPSRPDKTVGAFGDKFRKAREKRNFSLDDVSNVTKISSRMLQAIEEEHFDLLPGGVFNKGFIRAYAKHLGLNDEEAVTDYLACLRQAQIDAHEVWEPERPIAPRPAAPRPVTPGPAPQPTRQPQAYTKPALTTHPPVQVEDELPDLQLPRAEDVRPPRRNYGDNRVPKIPWGVVAIVAVVVLFALSLWIRHSRGPRTEAASASPATPAAAAQPVSLPTAAPTSSQPPHASSSPASTPSPHPAQPSTPASAKAVTATPSNSPSNPPAGTNANTNTNTITSNSKEEKPEPDVIVRTFPSTHPPAKPTASMTLIIRAAETSWIAVSADGQPVTHETLIAPAATSIRASREIVARIGNAAGVTFLWNGQEIPAQGTEAEVKTFLFDSTGIHEIPNQPSAQNR